MSVFKYEKDVDGIVVITMNMAGPVNTMNQEYAPAMAETVERLKQEQGLSGVVLTSAKKTFFAGGDLNDLAKAEKGLEQPFFEALANIKQPLRELEQLPVPVVSAINGAALGGGFEICLATNYRIAYNHRSVLIGLPEVGLGLLPGGGGVVRTVYLIGVQNALPYLLEGKKITPEKALAAGLIDQTVDSLDDLVSTAKAYILDNKSDEEAASQPWDRKGYKIPGGSANSPKVAQIIAGASAMLTKNTRGLLPAPEQILDCAIEATRVDFDTALTIESRGLTYLATTPQAKNMINTFFFQLNEINNGASRPANVAEKLTNKVGILGAGMMGQGIAYVSAKAGIEVVLKDISQDSADKGKAYTETLLNKQIKRGRMTEEKKTAILSLITATDNDADLEGCDLIIEAVFENMDLKHKLTKASEKYLSEGGVWGSNTSSLPITRLAEASEKPDNFIGLHFFSPVDKMPLLEIICGNKTSDETLARAFDYAKQIRKTPIVVNDSLGFFTSRTFGTYFDEAVRMVVEGLHPVKVDNLGKAFGMPVGPLTVHDEVSLELTRKAGETYEALGVSEQFGEAKALTEIVQYVLVENGRGGKHHGGGYFDYKDGVKTIWPGLLEKYYQPEMSISESDIKDRMLFRQVIETLKCLETKVLRSVADGNIGSIMGIGAPAWTGGYLQFINTYGLENFKSRCAELAGKYGDRFICPAIVSDKIVAGEQFK